MILEICLALFPEKRGGLLSSSLYRGSPGPGLCRVFGIVFWKSVSRWCEVVIHQLGRALPRVQRPCFHVYSSSAASASLPTSPLWHRNPWAFCTNSDFSLVIPLNNTQNILSLSLFFCIEYWVLIMSDILNSFVTVTHFFSSLQHLTKKLVNS